MVSKEPFINKEVGYIIEKTEMNCTTVSDYIIVFINIIEFEKKMCGVCKKRKTLIESVNDKLIMFIGVLNISN